MDYYLYADPGQPFDENWSAAVVPAVRHVTGRRFSAPVIYCSCPVNEHATRQHAKDHLVLAMLNHPYSCGWVPGPLRGTRAPSGGKVRTAIDTLGKPVLLISDKPGPSVCFTYLEGRVWAALGPPPYCVAIDAASSREFDSPTYPLHRAFGSTELEFILAGTPGKRGDKAALLWSAKEAVVKGLGGGFSLVAPLDLEIAPASGSGDNINLLARVSGRSRDRFPFIGSDPIPVLALKESGFWVSVSLVDPVQAIKTGCSPRRTDVNQL